MISIYLVKIDEYETCCQRFLMSKMYVISRRTQRDSCIYVISHDEVIM